MSKNAKNSQPASRPPVDALQYEKLALSTFDLCNRQLSQLDKLIALAASICRTPAVTSEDRQDQQTLLELLVSTGEQYRQEIECDRELFHAIALDATGFTQSRSSASRATRFLADANGESAATAQAVNRKRASAQDTAFDDTDDAQTIIVRH
ncbi:hypothetical protein [Paraburkholderia fungorum]|uniref:hypothetical protein n=1 Tax=Paraburkholderia fungorum TaxID=134537 RepID=UPI0038B92DB6